MQLARCHRELGQLNECISDCNAALTAAAGGSTAAEALLMRALAQEVLEHYALGIKDCEQILALTQSPLGPPPEAVHAIAQRRMMTALKH